MIFDRFRNRYDYLMLFSAFLVYFSRAVRTPIFGLGRGPITPAGPAMVRTDRKDPNSSKTKQTKFNATCSFLFPDAFFLCEVLWPTNTLRSR